MSHDVSHYTIDLLLQDDVVLTARHATAGAHQSLTHIPGSALLGWAAARLYALLPPEQAWQVFHSGAVCFGDGLPVAPSGATAFPVPLSWYTEKTGAYTLEPPEQAGAHEHQAGTWARWNPQAIANLALAPAEGVAPLVQARQLRQGFVSLQGEWGVPHRQERLMTAIAEDGQAAEGQLFAYESLTEGQRFRARLSVDMAVPTEAVKRLLACFEGCLRLGRSKATGYGRVQAQCTPEVADDAGSTDTGSETFTLLLLSDAWLRNAEGMAAAHLHAEALGLPQAELLPRQCFVRSRRYTPWNGHRGMPELERQVVSAGSVFTLRWRAGADASAQARLSRLGIGSARAYGLGRVVVNSPLLELYHPQPAPAPHLAAKPAPAGDQATSSVLLTFLQRQASRDGHGDEAQQFVLAALGQLWALWLKLRQFNATPPGLPAGPGRSQWGLLGSAALSVRSVEALRKALLGDYAGSPATARRGLVAENDADWTTLKMPAKTAGYPRPAAAGAPSGSSNSASCSLRSWIEVTLEDLQNDRRFTKPADQLDAWQRLCDQAGRARADVSKAALEAAASRTREAAKPAQEAA